MNRTTSRHERSLAPTATAPESRVDWHGAIAGRRTDHAELKLVLPLVHSNAGGSGAFLAAASDGNRYFIKPTNNNQGPDVCAAEQIVGRVGALIGAPTCEVRTIEITVDHEGWVFTPGRTLMRGIAHASKQTACTSEVQRLAHRREDDNSSRHVYIHALYDLCWGSDPQWLVDGAAGHAYCSHDHGWYFPPTGPTWTEQEMSSVLEAPNPCYDAGNMRGLKDDAIRDVASRLRALTKTQLEDVLAKVPKSWPISDAQLEATGHFILHRAPAVAARMEQYLGGLT